MRFWLASPDVEQAAKQYQQSVCMFYAVIAFIAVYVLASCIFNNMKTKLQRESFLMLPANNQEKFVARFLIMSIGGLIQLLVALVLADVIQFIFSFIITPGFHTSITWPILSHIFTVQVQLSGNDWLKMTTLYAFLLFAHSFATIGGAFYRKKPVLLTACTGILLFLIFGYTGEALNDLRIFDSIDFSKGTIAYYWATTLTITFLLTVAGILYWASYKIFTRMQVICNKWVNI